MNEYLIAQLKQGRLNKGLKQSDVTMQTGIKNTTLSNYENGVTEPDIDTFLCLCELYELDFVSIMEEAYGIKVPGRDFDIKPSEIEMIKKYRELDENGKATIEYLLQKEWENRPRRIEGQLSTLPVDGYYQIWLNGKWQNHIKEDELRKHSLNKDYVANIDGVDIVIEKNPKPTRAAKVLSAYANELAAAHERTDIEVTDDMKKHDSDIFDEENF